jgi:hypothetical protein
MTALGEVPSAISVATRRSAACSSASRSTSARDSVFATAVAISSVNWPSRASVSGGSGSSRVVPAAIAPHSRSSTAIGAATTPRMPIERTSSAIAPLAVP